MQITNLTVFSKWKRSNTFLTEMLAYLTPLLLSCFGTKKNWTKTGLKVVWNWFTSGLKLDHLNLNKNRQNWARAGLNLDENFVKNGQQLAQIWIKTGLNLDLN